MKGAPTDTSGKPLDIDSADFVTFTRRIPARQGKWRLLPPEVEKAAAQEPESSAKDSAL